MNVAASKRAFAEDPAGMYYVDRSWFSFCADERLWGLVVWGRFTQADAESLIDMFKLERAHPDRIGLVDTRHLEPPDMAAFVAFTTYVRGRSFDAYMRRVAIVHAHGPAGAMAAGFPKVIPMPFPMEAFTDLAKALTWLGRRDASALASEIDAIHARASGIAPLLRSVRTQLATNLVDATVEATAAALGFSVRNLQRRLRDHGTSFRDELGWVRMEQAKRLLASEDTTIAAVAFAVGCSSTQHFTTMFRKIVGITPTRWRTRLAP